MTPIPPKAIEAGARAMKQRRRDTIEGRAGHATFEEQAKICIEAYQAALAAEGMVLVPREPTPKMLAAAFVQANEQLLDTIGNMDCKTDEERSAHAVAPLYRAMISAASAGEKR